ncbi:MAG: alpha/beta fold hydrolase [Cypionkella sp.]
MWREIAADRTHEVPVKGGTVILYDFGEGGNLKDWNRVPDMRRITVPALFLCGRHDELMLACSLRMKQHMAQAEVKVFPNSAHMPFYEQPQACYPVLIAVLKRNLAA